MYHNNKYNAISCYVKGKGKVHPITDHEGPERVQIYLFIYLAFQRSIRVDTELVIT
jgi:hypothetical protein